MVVRVGDGEGAVHVGGGGEHRVAGAPGTTAARRHAVVRLDGDRPPAPARPNRAAAQAAICSARVGRGDQDDALETGLERVEDRVLAEGLVVRADRRGLLETAEASAAAGREEDEIEGQGITSERTHPTRPRALGNRRSGPAASGGLSIQAVLGGVRVDPSAFPGSFSRPPWPSSHGCGGSDETPLKPEDENPFRALAAGTDSTLDIVTWNLHGFAGQYGAETIGLVTAAIVAMDLDVMALQEVASASRFNQLVAAAARLGRLPRAERRRLEPGLPLAHRHDRRRCGRDLRDLPRPGQPVPARAADPRLHVRRPVRARDQQPPEVLRRRPPRPGRLRRRGIPPLTWPATCSRTGSPPRPPAGPWSWWGISTTS